MQKKVMIVKASGEVEEFDPNKVYRAVRRAGATEELAEEIVRKVSNRVKQGWTTHKIFRYTFKLLNEHKPEVASKYDIKGAIFRLGPEGHNFETFVGFVLQALGYKTEVAEILEGRCVKHEVDVIASKPGERLMVECKFHNEPGIKCSAQTGLYTYARFLDLTEGKEKFTEPMLVTNTKFTTDLIDYAQCRGIRLLGWSYPLKEGLEILIDRLKLYPITVLQNLDRRTMRILFENGVMLVKQLRDIDTREFSKKTGIPSKVLWRLRKEAERI
ncbi:MAG: restriction endonuclease [Candidatus Diapherotrites archaeon]|nr:restriction endonuclease [Candidatus Diapherotrites archaeon]